MSEPKVRDPNSGLRVRFHCHKNQQHCNIVTIKMTNLIKITLKVRSTKSWLTDQAYTGGVGDEFKGLGPVTNLNNLKSDMI